MVVDVQRGFVNRHSMHAVPAVVRLVEGWTAVGMPVVFSRFQNVPGSPYERISDWTHLRTSEEQALIDELEPYARYATGIIDKSVSSALTADLQRLVAERGWTDLVLCGIDTDSCVYDTAVAVYHRGLRPWIVTDACASTGGAEFHEAALLLARRNIGTSQLLTVDEVFDHLAAGANSDRRATGAFREAVSQPGNRETLDRDFGDTAG
ncbi:isochorismatase family cysteine hydrolase [Streptomyces luteogriseus]|uniref:isochorismatase family cysteine hydrolase n=1 Tax=Streptomyces luteogriseus TaxID=68233 RepID=UPI003809EF68